MRARFDRARPLRVLVVDDSATVRRMIATTLKRDARVVVVGEAADPYEAREKIKTCSPDALTLDIEMPGMDGLEFLSRLMRLRPMPVVMISTLTQEDSDAAVRALALGAVDCLDKRQILNPDEARIDLAEVLLTAGQALLRVPSAPREACGTSAGFDWNGSFVVIGSSTGGVDALTTVLTRLPPDAPPIVIAQHMPAMFLASFTERLNSRVPLRVVPAIDGAVLEQGCVMVAPGGDTHSTIAEGIEPRIAFVADEGERYVPLIDKLFRSAAPYGTRVVGVMLTGMGRDGADALLQMRQGGAHTIVEAAETAVVDGMPRAARELGAAVEVRRIEDIAQSILRATSRTGAGADAGVR